jgi:hypothetical protein
MDRYSFNDPFSYENEEVASAQCSDLGRPLQLVYVDKSQGGSKPWPYN